MAAAYRKGDVIGERFEVEAELGCGGFGEVYRVYIRGVDETVALKTFRHEFLADAAARSAFKREAFLWLNLGQHPNILIPYFVEEISGRLFIGMMYVSPDERGRVTLADHLRDCHGPLNNADILLYATQFCEGMEYANAHGITSHRDIKPSNILIHKNLLLLISDFGLATATEASLARRGDVWTRSAKDGAVGLSLFQTEGAGICGTPGYIAPELFAGSEADVRSDIYSFGLVLWQMATGSQGPPFAVGVAAPRDGNDVGRYALEINQRQLTGRVPAVAGPLRGVVEGCLAVKPSQRFASFAALRCELERVAGRPLEKVRTREPSDAGHWATMASSFLSLGRPEEAIRCINKALEIQPDNPEAYRSLGIALKQKGDLDGAIAAWREAVRLKPDDAEVHKAMGGALGDKGDTEGAMAEYRTAIRLKPDHAQAHAALGISLFKKGDYQAALEETDTAYRLAPADPAVRGLHELMQKTFASNPTLPAALAACRQATRLQPNDADARTRLGGVLRELGSIDEAIAEYRTAIRLQPENAAAHSALGNALLAKGDMEGASSAYREAIRLKPDHALAHKNLGVVLAGKGDCDGAIAAYREALCLQPDDPEVHYNLGIKLSEKGDADGAVTACRAAIRLKPDFALAHANLSICLAKKGDYQAAWEESVQAFALDPNQPVIRQLHEMMQRLKGQSPT